MDLRGLALITAAALLVSVAWVPCVSGGFFVDDANHVQRWRKYHYHSDDHFDWYYVWKWNQEALKTRLYFQTYYWDKDRLN